MKPISLTLRNIHSFVGEHRIDFEGLNLAVLTGQNGAGKSTLAYDALLFALFGETRSGADSIVAEGENVGSVEFVFALGEQVCLVSRQRSRKGGGSTTLHLEVDGAVLDGKTVAETQAKIEGLLHMTPELLRATAFSGQGQAAQFSQAKPADRKRVLGEILDLQAWERRAEAAREASRNVGAALERLSVGILNLQVEAERAPEIETMIGSNAGTLAKLQLDRGFVQGELATAQQQRSALVAQQEAAETKRRELADATTQLKQAQGAVAEREARLRRLEQATAWRASIEKELEAATAATQRADELLAARDADQAITQESKVLEARGATLSSEHNAEIARVRELLKAAKREYSDQVRDLDTQAQRLRDEHQRELKQLETDYGRLARQAEALQNASCAKSTTAEAAQMLSACPFIKDAREAEAQIAGVMEKLGAARAAAPWAEKQAELDALRLRADEIGAEHAARLRELEAVDPLAEVRQQAAALVERRRALAYTPGAWEAAKAEADKAPALRARMTEIETAAAQASEVQAGLDDLRSRVTELGTLVERLRSEVGDAAEIAKRLETANLEIGHYEQMMRNAEAEIAGAQAEAGRLDQQLKVAREAAERAIALQAEVQGHEKRRQLLELLGNPRSGAFSRSGIPALLIDQAVPDLEATANDMLRTLSDGKLGLQIRTQRETGERTMTETLDLIVTNERGERAYESYSGGERTRVDLAVRAALAQLLARRAGARCEMLVIDEPAGLDEEGQDELIECLGRLSEHFAVILLVTHIERLKDALACRIAVSKPNGGSRVEVLR